MPWAASNSQIASVPLSHRSHRGSGGGREMVSARCTGSVGRKCAPLKERGAWGSEITKILIRRYWLNKPGDWS
jgi:hypothetical protein